MNDSVLDFLGESIENKDLFDKVNSAKNKDKLYEVYKEYSSVNACDKDSFTRCVDELLMKYSPLESLDDSQIENVSGGINSSHKVAPKIIASMLSAVSIGGAISPSMSSLGANSDRTYKMTKIEQTKNFFEKHPHIKKLAIAGGTVALVATALYFSSDNKNYDDKEDSNKTESPKKNVNKENLNETEKNVKDVDSEDFEFELTSPMIKYSDNYWPEKLGNKPKSNKLDEIDIQLLRVASIDGRVKSLGFEPIDKDILNRIHFIKGDITKDVTVDCIVNPAMNSLDRGGGACGMIFKAAGIQKLEAEIKSLKKEIGLDSIQNGSAVITRAHDITNNIKTAKAIIHTPGPDIGEDMNKPKNACLELSSSYGASIELADKNGLKSIAFPSISTGIFQFPVEKASLIALYTVIKALEKYENMEVYFVVFNPDPHSYEYAKSEAERKAYDKMVKRLGKNYEN